MTVNQVYELLNDTFEQVTGQDALATLDLEGMVSMREAVFAAGSDKFLNTLVDRIAKTVIRTLKFRSSFPRLLMEEYEFGCIIAKINVDPMPAQSQEAWNVGEQDFVPTNFKIDKPTVHVGYFRNSDAFEIDVTITDVMFKSAFQSAEEMGAFITAIFDSMSTSFEMHLEDMTRLAICGFIAEKCYDGNGVVDLLSWYNETAATPIYSADKALQTKDFLLFAGKTMRDFVKYIAKPSVLYNMGGYVRSTPSEDLNIMVLSEFASACATYLESSTYHDEMVKLPGYMETEFWQATGNTLPTFYNCSSLSVELPSDGTSVTQHGVVAVFADREAIFTGLFDKFSAVDRNNRNRYSNHTLGATVQTCIDPAGENGIIFVLVDQPEPEPGN